MTDRCDRGTVLLLVPAAVLVMILLGSIAVDLSLVFLAHQDLTAAAAAAANDAVTYGLDERAYRERGVLVLDPRRVRAAVRSSLDARGLTDLAGAPAVTIDGLTVRVALAQRVRYVLAPAIAGAARRTTVTAAASARAVTRCVAC